MPEEEKDSTKKVAADNSDSPSQKKEKGESDKSSAPPRVLGDFQLLRKLGSGGMGDVFLAKQISLKRQVALKVMRSELVKDEKLLQRFKTEASAAALLNHPNIVQVYMIGEVDGYHFIAQEYVDGWNLREHLVKKGTTSAALTLRIIRQVASALKKAGDVGIVHRDIKPENIMLTRKGVVKVADFGLARLNLEENSPNLTQVGMTMGTPSYMSPEQVHGKKVDTRSDIYSLGVTCYHMVAGQPPFQGETALSIVVQHVNEEPPPLAHQRNDVPKALCEMIHKMMEKVPKDRYPDAGALAADAKKLIVASQKGKDIDAELANQTDIDKGEHWNFVKEISWKSFLLYAVPTLLIFAALGWYTRPGDPLLSPLPQVQRISKAVNVEEQYVLAEKLNTEEGWNAVIDNYTADLPEVKNAKEQLALLLIRKNDFEKAQRIFDDFESYGSDDKSLFSKGLAGKAIIACLEKRYDDSHRIIQTRLEGVNTFLEGPLRPLVRETIKKNNQELDNSSKDLLDLFKDDEEDSEEI